MLSFAAILRRKVLEVSLTRSSNFESSCDLDIFTAISMRINFSHLISFKVASYSVCYLTNGDDIRYLLEKLKRENRKQSDRGGEEVKCFQFYFK